MTTGVPVMVADPCVTAFGNDFACTNRMLNVLPAAIGVHAVGGRVQAVSYNQDAVSHGPYAAGYRSRLQAPGGGSGDQRSPPGNKDCGMKTSCAAALQNLGRGHPVP